jgi:trans-2,3-dihydro-3-hydroxyanthranilate isomerase
MSIPPVPAGYVRTEYALVDVFAESPLEGNMLAIFTDARHLSTETMQALARETNLAETTFIIPRDAAIEAERGVQVRIFTTQEELQFAGHPTLGTATWLYLNHPVLRGSESITLDLPVGPIRVVFEPGKFGTQDATKPGVFATMQQKAPTFGTIHSPEAIAAALGLSVNDLDPTLPIQTVSTGMAFCIVPLRSMEVASRLCIPQDKAQAYLDSCDAKFFYCITRTSEGSTADWHNRMQFYNGEDPATGSASGCTIAYLVHHKAAVNDRTVVFEQGIEINRPSRIEVRAAFSTDQQSIPDLVFVGGRTIPVAHGAFFLP